MHVRVICHSPSQFDVSVVSHLLPMIFLRLMRVGDLSFAIFCPEKITSKALIHSGE